MQVWKHGDVPFCEKSVSWKSPVIHLPWEIHQFRRFSDDQKLRQEMVKAGALNVAKQVGHPAGTDGGKRAAGNSHEKSGKSMG